MGAAGRTSDEMQTERNPTGGVTPQTCGGAPRRFAIAPLVAGLAVTWGCVAPTAQASEFYGLNAGAPVWNGAIQLTPQEATQIASTGTGAIRVNFRLDAGAAQWNSTQLGYYDQIIANARNAGLKVLGLMSNETVAGGQFAWNDDPDGDGVNGYVTDFASTAQLLVDRYKGDIKQWEVWNEPNAWANPAYASDPQNAGGTYILPRVYAQMLSQTYLGLNSGGQSLLEDHGITLATGGLLAHDIGGSFSTAMPYFNEVYDQTGVWNQFETTAGRRYPWDDFGYHFYISQGSLVSQSQLANYFNAVRSAKSARNDPSDILVTEFGWQTVGTNTEQLQRDNMAAAYDYLAAQSDVSGTYWYQWEDDPGENWGLVYANGAPKLAYAEFAARNGGAPGAVAFETYHAASDAGLAFAYSSDDLLQGLIATERAGDLGWHSANPAASNGSLDPNGLPAFTDGAGDLGSGLTGLLNDHPASGAPAKSIEYALAARSDIDEIRIFTGNAGKDGRIFSTTAVYTSVDGQSFELLGYFQSDPSGAVNSGAPADGATLVRILRTDGESLREAVTHLRFDLFAVADLAGAMRDPFDGVNSFTGADDSLARAYVSPLVREIDVLGSVIPASADFDEDMLVDGGDFLIWQRGVGTAGGATLGVGDANGDGAVTAADLSVWQFQFGHTAATRAAVDVPEPRTLPLFALAGLAMTCCVSGSAPRRAPGRTRTTPRSAGR